MRNRFFLQNSTVLAEKRKEVIEYLRIKGIDNKRYLQAYDYFATHNEEFDGATIVKDLDDLPDLPLAAMVHDWRYVHILLKYNGWRWLKIKVRFDWEYGKNLEALGKGAWVPYVRAVGLIISTPLYPIYKLIKKRTNE